MVAATLSVEQVYEWLADVPDPEIPVLSILDLGIVRDVTVEGTAVEGTVTLTPVVVPSRVTVTLTPTYSGCPATEAIESSVLEALKSHGIHDIAIRRSLSPPWTSDWISDAGCRKLLEYGIAPPEEGGNIACPQCESLNTELLSEFGSTACKASWRCLDCLEPFENFKCI